MRLPKTNKEFDETFENAVDDTSLNSIQRGFVRSYSGDANGDVAVNLVPNFILSWYDDDEMSSGQSCPGHER